MDSAWRISDLVRYLVLNWMSVFGITWFSQNWFSHAQMTDCVIKTNVTFCVHFSVKWHHQLLQIAEPPVFEYRFFIKFHVYFHKWWWLREHMITIYSIFVEWPSERHAITYAYARVAGLLLLFQHMHACVLVTAITEWQNVHKLLNRTNLI